MAKLNFANSLMKKGPIYLLAEGAKLGGIVEAPHLRFTSVELERLTLNPSSTTYSVSAYLLIFEVFFVGNPLTSRCSYNTGPTAFRNSTVRFSFVLSSFPTSFSLSWVGIISIVRNTSKFVRNCREIKKWWVNRSHM